MGLKPRSSKMALYCRTILCQDTQHKELKILLVLEAKLKGKTEQYSLINKAIYTALFVRNKTLRLWMDVKAHDKYDLNKYCAVLAKEFDFAKNYSQFNHFENRLRALSGVETRFLSKQNRVYMSRFY